MKVFLLYTIGCLLVLTTWVSSKNLISRRQNSDLADVTVQLGLNALENTLISANLDGVLTGDGPLTVFGPTDAAFEEVTSSNADIGPIEDVLKYHVVPGEFKSGDLKNEQLLDTALEGKQIRINEYTVNNNLVVTAQCAPLDLSQVDSEASNGVIHVVDRVLLPPSGTISDAATNTDILSTLTSALEAAQLVDALAGDGPFTVFAPSDDAFNKLPWAFLNSVLADPGLLTRVLLYHVVQGTYCSAGLSNATVTAMSGDDLTISVLPDGVFVDEAQVVAVDVSVTNGVVHIIDNVLLPADIHVA